MFSWQLSIRAVLKIFEVLGTQLRVLHSQEDKLLNNKHKDYTVHESR